MSEELKAAHARAAARETTALIANAKAAEAARNAGTPTTLQPFANPLERMADEDGPEEIPRDGGIMESADAPPVSIPAPPLGVPDQPAGAKVSSDADASAGEIQIPRSDSADAQPVGADDLIPPTPPPVEALKGDTPAAVAFLQRLSHPFPTLTAIPVDPETHRKMVEKIETKSFPAPVAWGDVSKWINGHQGHANIYWSTNPLREPKDRKALKSDIDEVVMLQVDVDVPEGQDQEGVIATMLAKVDRLELTPTFVINSGGGLQIFYMLIKSDRIKLNGDADIARAEALTRGVELEVTKKLGVTADATFNVDRIMRLPGTINVPDKKKVLKGRKAALAKLLKIDDDGQPYPRSAFTPAPVAAPTGNGQGPAADANWQDSEIDWGEVARLTPQSRGDLPEGLSKKALAIIGTERVDDRKIFHAVNAACAAAGVAPPKPYGSNSAVTQALAASMNNHKDLSDERKAGIFMADFPCNDHIHQKENLREKRRAVLRSIGRAFKPKPSVAAVPEGLVRVDYDEIQLTSCIKQVESALVANTDKVGIYRQGSRLVQAVQFDAPHGKLADEDGRVEDDDGIRRSPGSTLIRTLPDTRLIEAISDTVAFVVPSRDGGTKRIPVPARLDRHLMNRTDVADYKILNGIVGTPTITPAGHLLTASGYHEPSGLMLELGRMQYGKVPEHPTREDALAALALLCDVLREFPFDDNDGLSPSGLRPTVSRSVFLAALLTSLVRKAMRLAPLFGITASTPGTGKSLLATLIAIIAQGRPAAAFNIPPSEEEFVKRLDSSLLSGSSMINIDNVSRPLTGDALCSLLSEETVDCRALGSSEKFNCSTMTLVTATGNNLRFGGDMYRRGVLCSLNAQVERPDLRTFDRPDLTSYVLEHRAELVVACLTIIHAHNDAGRPGAKGLQPFGIYHDWLRWIRGALVWLGQPDPVLSIEQIAVDDPEGTAFRQLIAAIAHSQLGQPNTDGPPKMFKPSALISLGVSDENIREALSNLGARASGPRSLADYLTKQCKRIAPGGFFLEAVKNLKTQRFEYVLRCNGEAQKPKSAVPAQGEIDYGEDAA